MNSDQFQAKNRTALLLYPDARHHRGSPGESKDTRGREAYCLPQARFYGASVGPAPRGSSITQCTAFPTALVPSRPIPMAGRG